MQYLLRWHSVTNKIEDVKSQTSWESTSSHLFWRYVLALSSTSLEIIVNMSTKNKSRMCFQWNLFLNWSSKKHCNYDASLSLVRKFSEVIRVVARESSKRERDSFVKILHCLANPFFSRYPLWWSVKWWNNPCYFLGCTDYCPGSIFGSSCNNFIQTQTKGKTCSEKQKWMAKQ